MVPFGQGFRDMSPPTKELYKLTLEKKIAHGGHPVLRWCMDNVVVRTDPAGNIKIDKGKVTEKELNDKVRRVLRLFFRTTMNRGRGYGFLCSEAHYAAARQLAEDGIVGRGTWYRVAQVYTAVKRLSERAPLSPTML